MVIERALLFILMLTCVSCQKLSKNSLARDTDQSPMLTSQSQEILSSSMNSTSDRTLHDKTKAAAVEKDNQFYVADSSVRPKIDAVVLGMIYFQLDGKKWHSATVPELRAVGGEYNLSEASRTFWIDHLADGTVQARIFGRPLHISVDE